MSLAYDIYIQSHHAAQHPLFELVQKLPSLPDTIRYYDEFDDVIRTIKHLDKIDCCELFSNGEPKIIQFNHHGLLEQKLIKHLIPYLLSEDFQPASVYNYVNPLNKVSSDDIARIVLSGPMNIKSTWTEFIARKSDLHPSVFMGLKSILNFLAKFNMCEWNQSYRHYISSLPLPYVDKYASVRSGDVFLNQDEESKIVGYLDMMSDRVKKSSMTIDMTGLHACGMLVCSYQFGMRPVQIASLTLADVRIFDGHENHNQSIHLTFSTAKKRSKSSSRPLLRKVKAEWVPIIAEIFNRYAGADVPGNTRLFNVKSAGDVSTKILVLSTEITGRECSANILRHTAAQRLVDAGASQEELAEFMGHSDITTGLVYFSSSPNQAERVNQALGISPVYSKVMQIAHDRFISPDELAQLKGDQQIAGVPHGIPIAGIGGCSSGQPSCPFNPITSCYGCQKFMPISDAEIHKRVLNDLRGVVTFFDDASKHETNSPAFLQLKRTIAEVQVVISEIGDRK